MGSTPTDEQLARMERTVLDRIDRRIAARRRLRNGAFAVVVIAGLGGGIGGIVQVLGGTGTSASSIRSGEYAGPKAAQAHDGASTATEAAGSSAAPAVRCYAATKTGGTVTTTSAAATASDAQLAAACAKALEQATTADLSAGAAHPFVCIDAQGRRFVFGVAAMAALTQTDAARCAANGLRSR